MLSRMLRSVLIGLFVVAAVGQEQTSKPASTQATTREADEELTLEKLFPEKGLFGPSASSTAFSRDGKYAGYLYRPYIERRHGSDLWLLDTASGDARRVTSASVMSRFQADTRKVKEDRIKKAKKAAKKKGKGKAGESDGKQSEKDDDEEDDDGDEQDKDDADKQSGGKKGNDDEKDDKGKKNDKDDKDDGDDDDELGDRVDDKDADAEKAPRYAGVSRFTWAPEANELLFTSGGDIYRMYVETGEIARLTRTKESERDVQYLPDGAGYTYMRGSALIKVAFDSHIIEQINPELGDGESMSSYRLSPDGKRVVFLTRKTGKPPKPPRRVKIAKYRERFMKVTEVPRVVSDDPLTPAENTVYLYEINDPMAEDGDLWKVHTHKISGPRDVFRVPEWSPDSSRVTFAVFEQSSGHVQILVADFPDEEEIKAAEEKEAEKDAEAGKEQGEDDDSESKKDEQEKEQGSEDEEKPDKKKKDDIKERKARVAYRFLHNGGPNTPRMMRPYYLPDSRRIIFLSEQSGFRQLHLLDPLYEASEQLTRGRYEIYPIELSKDHKWLFVTATKERPSRQEIYRVSTEDGTMTRLVSEDGSYNSVAVSQDGAKVLANHVTYGKLRELIYSADPSQAPKRLTDSHPEKATKYTQAHPEFFSYTNRHGHEIHGHMFKPDGWTASDQRPLLIYVYGGPLGSRKMVVDGSYNADSYLFAWYMAKKNGYVTCTIDPRGVSGYGGMFEKANFEQVGRPQVEDLVDGAKWFVENQGVDEKRIGLHGWSFGGFQTQMCLYTEPDVFACGIAGAGPTEWENYNSWYSTGTIGKSRTGETDLKKFSLLPLAKNLKSKLLLVHGMEDRNVLYQDTVRVYRELLKAGKETLVELFLDPTGGHGLGGDIKRVNRARKYEEFLLRNLGTGKPAVPTTQPSATAPAGDAEQAESTRERPANYVREHFTKHEYRIPMRDGVHLFTVVYTPKDASEPLPILMRRTPYSVRPYGEDKFPRSVGPSRLLRDDGYFFVYQDVRGCYMSEGEFVNMTPHIANKTGESDIDESTDSYDTIEWLLENLPNHNGKVGLWGISYPGFYAAASMIDAHPALAAVSPQAPIADWYFDDFHHHGALFLPHTFNFFASFGRPRPAPTTQRSGPRFDHGTRDGYEFFLELGPLKNANELHFKGEIPFWNKITEHPNYDEFWQSRNILPHLRNVAPAVMTVGGWFDAEDLYGALQIYRSVERKNPGIFNILVMGPWRHGGWSRGRGEKLGGVHFGSETSRFYRETIERPFFNHYLKGQGELDLPEAYVFETGANEWRTFDHWPPKDLQPKSLYFNADGGLSFERPDERGEVYDEYVSDPNDPVPFTEAVAIGMTREYMTDDQRFAAARPDVLAYQTDILADDVTLAGPLVADLWVSTSGSASDWIVKLIDVFPEDESSEDEMAGYQMMVRSEVIRGRFRDSYKRPKPFVPDRPTRVKLELQDVLHTFQRGHRIMVQIQSTWFPLVDRNPQKYVDNIFEADEDDFIQATQRVYRSRRHPTRIRVGVLPATRE